MDSEQPEKDCYQKGPTTAARKIKKGGSVAALSLLGQFDSPSYSSSTLFLEEKALG